jgi:chromate transporter
VARAGLRALLLWLGPGNVFAEIAIFFSKMAVVTFGGAYAVLAYVAQQAVDNYGWLQAGRDAGRPRHGRDDARPADHGDAVRRLHGRLPRAGPLRRCSRATLGGLLTTWVTFTPCFLWIFLGAPFIEALRGNKALSAALGAITAAVVGVILNLAVWFALHVLFPSSCRCAGGRPRSIVPVAELGRPVPSLVLSAAAAWRSSASSSG